MINRRKFVASGATGAAFLGTATGAMATRSLVDGSPADHFARAVTSALTTQKSYVIVSKRMAGKQQIFQGPGGKTMCLGDMTNLQKGLNSSGFEI